VVFSASTNKTDRYDISEIMLKVALNTIALTLFGTLIIQIIRKIVLFIIELSNTTTKASTSIG
jgi:hypothetical protein